MKKAKLIKNIFGGLGVISLLSFMTILLALILQLQGIYNALDLITNFLPMEYIGTLFLASLLTTFVFSIAFIISKQLDGQYSSTKNMSLEGTSFNYNVRVNERVNEINELKGKSDLDVMEEYCKERKMELKDYFENDEFNLEKFKDDALRIGSNFLIVSSINLPGMIDELNKLEREDKDKNIKPELLDNLGERLESIKSNGTKFNSTEIEISYNEKYLIKTLDAFKNYITCKVDYDEIQRANSMVMLAESFQDYLTENCAKVPKNVVISEEFKPYYNENINLLNFGNYIDKAEDKSQACKNLKEKFSSLLGEFQRNPEFKKYDKGKSQSDCNRLDLI